jgi:hypothetical protein
MSYTYTQTQTYAAPTMAQIRGTAGYNLGSGPSRFGGAGYGNMKSDATSDPSPLDTIREQTSKIEDWLDTLSDPIKPYACLRPHGCRRTECSPGK